MEQYNIKPSFDSNLTSILFSLESVRYRFVSGSTPLWLFYDLRDVLQLLESLFSARIEGNHTKLSDAVDNATKHGSTAKQDDASREIENIQNAIVFIEDNIHEDEDITLSHIRTMHSIVMKDLKRDSSKTPGSFRLVDGVSISGSDCVVSKASAIQADMQELMDYVNTPHEKKEDLIRIACAHHRMVAIHPFDNGNGRTARLLTYAMLIKYGFLKHKKTLLNPSAIFCMDRHKYYDMLSEADHGNIEQWCEYVAHGILDEVNRMFKLLDKDYVVKNVINPALQNAWKDNKIDEKEYRILEIAIKNDTIQQSDVLHLFGSSNSDRVTCSRFLASMTKKELIMRPPATPRKYVFKFFNKELLPYVMISLANNGLIQDDESI